eukprot:m.739801 g.739801  ORF g.739801 m.739801 type:complete len:1039 (-) comp23110_c0_seq5:3234-6350(-)
MLAKRAKRLVPLMEPRYEMKDVPRCQRDLTGSVVVRPQRDELQDSMAEIVLLVCEAVDRHNSALQKSASHAGNSTGSSSALVASKPLSIEFIADRLDVDDPLEALCVRTQADGFLQGIITWTTFTTWQRYFRWDSRSTSALLHEYEDKQLQEKNLDYDGKLADALQQTVFEGDPEDSGVVWPRIAEISLLGAIGCGRWLMESVIEELEKPSSPYEYVVLQATSNSIAFYESLGFKRVGAVARYTLSDEKDDDTKDVPMTEAEYNFNQSYVSSPTYWYTDTKDDETPKQIAAKCNVEVADVLFLNKILYGEDGLSASSRLKRGTPLRIPTAAGAGASTRASLGGLTYTTTRNKETPKSIAAAAGVAVGDLVALNKVRHRGLSAASALKAGTQLLMPAGDGHVDADDAAELATLSDEVAYRHWTFIDDSVEYTEPSYMMVYALTPMAQRTKRACTKLSGLGARVGSGRPDVLRVPLGCKNASVFGRGGGARRTNGVNGSTKASTPEGKGATVGGGSGGGAVPPPPTKPKRPMGAYFCFSTKMMPVRKAEHPELSRAALATALGQEWQAMDAAAKAGYHAQAAENKAAFTRALAAYTDERRAYDKRYGVAPAGATPSAGTAAAGKGKGAVPSKLFNKVVSVVGREGPWFVLTYIPDLQWCHLGPCIPRGKFGLDKRGNPTENTGQPRWVLAPEGTAAELDTSAFNCTVIKSRTVRKVQDADKEEWCIVDPTLFPVDAEGRLCVGAAPGTATTPPPDGVSASSPTDASEHAAPPAVQRADSDPNEQLVKKRAVDIRAFFGRSETAHLGNGGIAVAAVGATAGEAASVKPPPDVPGTAARPTDASTGTATATSHTAHIGAWFKPATVAVDGCGTTGHGTAHSDALGRFHVGESVTAQWAGRGAWHPGQVTAVHTGVGVEPTYSVQYDDGDFEPSVPASRMRPLRKHAKVQKIEEYAVGETVLGDWKGRGKMFQGRVTAVGNLDHSNAAFRTYTVEYEDGDCETLVPPRRLKKAKSPTPAGGSGAGAGGTTARDRRKRQRKSMA